MVARNTSVSLGKHFTEFIREQVESGRYNTASDVIRASLRLMEEREQKLEWLRAEIAKAVEDFEQGRYREMDDNFWDDLNREVDERIARGEEPNPDVLP